MLTALTVAVALGSGAGIGFAQEPVASSGLVPAEHIDALRERLSQLESRAEWAKERADALEEVSRTEREATFRNRVDTVRVGPFRVIGMADRMARDLPLIRERWERFRSGIPGAATLDIDGLDLVIARSGTDPIRSLVQSPNRPIFPAEWAEVRPGSTPESDRIFAQIVHWELPDAAREWAGLDALLPRFDWDRATRGVLASTAPVTEACLEGDDAVCLDLMGLPEPPSPRWSDPASVLEASRFRRDRILRLYPDGSWARHVGEVPGCGENASREACLERLTTRGYWSFVRPTERAAHDGLARAALEMGGSEALARAMRLPEDATVEETLEALAGAPLGTVVDRWRDRLLAVGNPGSDSRRGSGSALLWAGLFGLASLTSSRWRS